MEWKITKKAICSVCGKEMECCGVGSRGFFFECKKCGNTEEVEREEVEELKNNS